MKRDYKKKGAQAILATGLGQALAFLMSLALVRVFTPQDMGVFTVFLSIFAIGNTASTLRYDQAIMYTKNAIETKNIVRLCLYILMFLIITGYITAALFNIEPISENNDLFLLFLSLSILFSAAIRIANMVWARLFKFQLTALINLSKPLLIGTLQLLFGFMSLGAIGLFLGHSLALFILCLVMIARHQEPLRYLMGKSTIKITKTAKSYASFPTFNLGQNMAYVASESATPLFIAFYYGEIKAGLYWLAARIAITPMQVIAESLRPIIQRKIIAELKSNIFRSRNIILYSIALASPFILAASFLYITGDPLFSILFGKEWKSAAILSVILLINSGIQAAIIPIQATLPIIDQQKSYMITELASGILRLTLLIILSQYGYSLTTSLLLSIIGASSIYLVWSAFIAKNIKKKYYLSLKGST